ncbi:MAG: hypothetical protein ACK5HS_01905, partial [Mycoplasmatales bacterium]
NGEKNKDIAKQQQRIGLRFLTLYFTLCDKNIVVKGGLAQLGEHQPYKMRVTGSRPVFSTI